MNPYDQEPAQAAPGEQALTPARIAATAAAALPAVGFGLLCLRQGIAEARPASPNCAFHLALGVTLLVLFAHVAVFIQRADELGWILFAGVGGFGAAFGAAMLVELSGPRGLAVLALAVLIFAIVVWRRPQRH